jgi:hypothetical protein
VEKDPRSGQVLRNPDKTLEIEETATEPPDALFAVTFKGKVYSIIDKPAGDGRYGRWNQETFEVLYQLFQMTVTDITRVPVPPITISK